MNCECGQVECAPWCPGLAAVSGEIDVSTARDSVEHHPAGDRSHEPSSISAGLRELRDAKPVVGARGGILLDFTMYDDRFEFGGEA